MHVFLHINFKIFSVHIQADFKFLSLAQPTMTNIISAFDLSSNHLSRSIIIIRGGARRENKPRFMNSTRFSSVPWPTPATLTYHEVVSDITAHFYWYVLESREKAKYLKFMCQELMYQGVGRVYKRSNIHQDLLVKVDHNEFEAIISRRLLNRRYECRNCPGSAFYAHSFSMFTPGEKVLVDSTANQCFEGTYQFD